MSRDLSPGVTWHGMGQSWVRLDLLEGIKANPAPGINIHSSSTMVSSNLGSHVATSDLSHRDGNNDPNHDLTELIFFFGVVFKYSASLPNLAFQGLVYRGISGTTSVTHGKHGPAHGLPF